MFVASPADVDPERQIIVRVAQEWNDLWSGVLGIRLEVLRWETHAYPDAGMDAQHVINSQVGADYDIFLGVMWSRLGTPTQRAPSGTVEEFGRALTSFRVRRSPKLMFYFKEPPSIGGDELQLDAIREFQKKISTEGVLYWTFQTTEQFEALTRIHLVRQVQDWALRNGVTLGRDRNLTRRLDERGSDPDLTSCLVTATKRLNTMHALTKRISAERGQLTQAFLSCKETIDLASGPDRFRAILSALEVLANEHTIYAEVTEALLKLYERASTSHLDVLLRSVMLSLNSPEGPMVVGGGLLHLRESTRDLAAGTEGFASTLAKPTIDNEEWRATAESAASVTSRLASRLWFEVSALDEVINLINAK